MSKYLQEYCKEDGKMSKDFLKLVRTKGSKLYTVTCIGRVKKAKNSDYVNSVIYYVELLDE